MPWQTGMIAWPWSHDDRRWRTCGRQVMKAAIGALTLLGVAMWSGAACADTRITFAHPDRYTDANLYGNCGTRSWQPAVDGIGSYLKRLGGRHFAPGQVLTIEVLDMALAALIDPFRSQTVRIMSPATWPRIKMRYTLAQNGRMLTRGEETIFDLEYLSNAVGRSSGDPLRYEKAMLDDWFRARFAGGGR